MSGDIECTRNMVKKYKTLVAIIAIAVIEMYALSLGINGTLMSLTIAAIAGLGGYELKNKNGKKDG